MKSLSLFSYGSTNFLVSWQTITIILVSISSTNIRCVTAKSTSAESSSTEKIGLEGNGSGSSDGGFIGDGNSTEITALLSSVDTHSKNDKARNNSKATTTEGSTALPEVIPTWIVRKFSTFEPRSPPRTRLRTTKVLEKPLESQLISQFHEPKRLNERKNVDLLDESHSTGVPSLTTAHLSRFQQTSSEKRQRLLRRNKYTSAAVATKTPTASSTSSNNRQDNFETVSSSVEGLEGVLPPSPSEIAFTNIVSPIEGSLGGLSGLQGLPPLSPVQFIKLLVSVTPFIIPLIFIPLLIFTIGLLMIPVTRANVFVDVGDLRSPSSSIFPSFISTYVVDPIKSTMNGGSGALLATPRSLAYDLSVKLVDTEQCVERISCEISARYLHSTWEQGDWRSIANTSWMSRIINYFWGGNPTISRIAKSLEAIGDRNGESVVTAKENDMRKNYAGESKKNVTKSSGYLGFQRSSRERKEACRRFTCQPNSLMRKFLSPFHQSISS